MTLNHSHLRLEDLAKAVVLSLLLLSFLGVKANGQGTPITITIRVKDTNDDVIPDALVVLKRDGTPVRTGITSSDGTLVLKDLQPGSYSVEVSAKDFTATSEPVNWSASTTFDVKLVPSGPGNLLNQPPPPLTEKKPEPAPEQISSLPNQQNDLTPLALVTTNALPLGPSALGLIVVDGKGVDQQTARLDGVDFMVLTPLPGADPAIDPVSSFTAPAVAADTDKSKLRTGAFESRYGPGTGAISDTVSYTGFGRDNKKWTGEFYGEHRNDAFNARNFFDYEGKNALRRTRFGGKASHSFDSAGHSMVFLAYDGIRGRIERPVYEAVPVDSTCCSNQPFAQLFRSYLPAGTQIVAGASLNPDFLVARRRTRTSVSSNAYDARFELTPFADRPDSDVKKPMRFTLRYTRQGTDNVVPDGVTGRQQRQDLLFNNFMASFSFKTNSVTTHTIRFGRNSVRANVATEIPAASDPSLSAAAINVSGSVDAVGLPAGLTSVSVASVGALVKSVGRGFRLAPVTYSLSYEFERTFGVDDLLVGGVEGRLVRIDVDRLGGLTYAFPNLAALRTGTPTSVSFQSDLSAASPFNSGVGPKQARQNYVTGYIQMLSNLGKRSKDPTFKDTDLSRLRVTYGVRYDYFSPVSERDNRVVLVDPATGAILPAGTKFYSTPKFDFQPRASVIYRFADAGVFANTVFTGRAGIYAGTGKTGDYLLPLESDRFSTGMIGTPFPVDPLVVQNNFLTHPESRQFQPLAFSRDFVGVERAYKWDAKLSQTFKGYDLAFIYTGNAGRHLPLANIANRIINVFTNPDPTQPAIVQREFDSVQGGQIFKPLGEFFFRSSDGRSSYNAMTIQFSRNPDASSQPGSTWLAAAVAALNAQYIFSRSVGNASGTLLSNPFDVEADFGNNGGVPRHLFKLSTVYELWRGPNSSPAKKWLDWKIMPALRVSSGLPLLVRLNRPDVVYRDANGLIFVTPAVGRTAIINTPGGGESGAARVPNLISGVNPYLRNDREFLNPAAFSVPAPGEFGNIRRGELFGPNAIQLDLGIRRNLFDVEGKASAQFQIDIFNVFNRTNFSNPTAPLAGVLGTDLNQVQPGVAMTRGSAGTFGLITAADTGRVIQFSFTVRLNDGFTSYRNKN